MRTYLAFFLICFSITINAQQGKLKALVGGTLIDGFGSEPIKNSVILIEGERIKAVGTIATLPVPNNAKVISTEGMSVLPGLWDMHVHFRGGEELISENKQLLNLFLAYGVTTVRDAGGDITPVVLDW